ncbi:MAG: ral secretion pathway protein [Acidobacteriota bacterium]|nr:ral secretion pathway protein [Acidobacteriota bacterium]MDT7778128.1 ral secretion pathway protein [Acidobacteriota bacterium]
MTQTLTVANAILGRYGLAEDPFSLSPDPRFLYLTNQHKAALAKLRYVLERRQGFAVLYGDVGHGKSTLIRRLFGIYREQQEFESVLVTNPDYPTALQLLKRLTDEFGLARRPSKLDQMQELEGFLVQRFADDKNVLVLIDEAQMMKGEQFELIRQITNFESDDNKLVQIILAGQNNLRNKLKLKRALLSRSAAVATLDPLTPEETADMISFRLSVAGRHNPLFTREAHAFIYDRTKGVPREVVKMCMNALTIGGLMEADLITAEVVNESIE